MSKLEQVILIDELNDELEYHLTQERLHKKKASEIRIKISQSNGKIKTDNSKARREFLLAIDISAIYDHFKSSHDILSVKDIVLFLNSRSNTSKDTKVYTLDNFRLHVLPELENDYRFRVEQYSKVGGRGRYQISINNNF